MTNRLHRTGSSCEASPTNPDNAVSRSRSAAGAGPCGRRAPAAGLGTALRGLSLLLALLTAGCLHTGGRAPGAPADRAARPPAPALRRAMELYEQGSYNAALMACIEVSQKAPETPGLDVLRNRILAAVMEQEAERAAAWSDMSRNYLSMESERAALLPLTYGARRPIEPLPLDHLSPDSPMRDVLDRKVSLSLKGANLSSFIEALAADGNINLIADRALGSDKTIDVEIEDAPLREILDYSARNLGVQFFLGDHIIWAVAPDAKAAPMETRAYRLRRGIQVHGGDWGSPPGAAVHDGDIGMLTRKATVLPEGRTYLEAVIEKMVPAREGAVLHFDRSLHTLFVRNTRENLILIDQLVQALDQDPPQVQIEARFIEVSVGDLRELGIDWIFDSPIVLGKKGVWQDGAWGRQPKMQVGEGASVDYQPFTTTEGGVHPLGPQGNFGLFGNPPTVNQGLNLTVQGVLTDPLFRATLHALDISGKGRTLSVPRVTTMNNNPAKLRSGRDLRYYEEFQAQAFQLTDANNQRYTVTVLIPKGTPSKEELGITLLAVPSVGADRRTISLLLNPIISDLEGFMNYQDDSLAPDPALPDRIRQVVVKLPIFTRREVQTKLTVQSGETVVMGGLIRTVTQDTVHKVPLLGDLPLLGGLFRRTDRTEERKNLLIFVTATVISDRGESMLADFVPGEGLPRFLSPDVAPEPRGDPEAVGPPEEPPELGEADEADEQDGGTP